MNARDRFVVTLTLGLAVGLLMASGAAAAGGVSPGTVDRFAVARDGCPTFSWEASAGADAFELVAFALPPGLEPGLVADHHLTAETEVLYQRIPGGATGWTPSAEQCLAPGGRYVWFVRSAAGDEPSPWSEGRYFTVPAAPSAEELARAFAVLQRYADAAGEPTEPAQVVADASTRPVSTPRLAKGGGSGASKSVPTAPAAVRGDNPDTVGELYGVVGTSASISGAGVGAANTAGGPDLVLDGSANGEVDTLISESGIDRASADTEVFTVSNSGGGTMVLEVEGTLEATALDCPGCVGATQLASSAVTSAKIATGAVTGAKILDRTVTAADLADAAVTGAKIADGAVDSGTIRSNAVTSAKILDGTITAADVDLTSGIYVSRSQLYEREESVVLVGVGILPADVYCDDANDLPLAASCVVSSGVGVEVDGEEAIDWAGSTSAAGWECLFNNVLGGTHTGRARILCISVP